MYVKFTHKDNRISQTWLLLWCLLIGCLAVLLGLLAVSSSCRLGLLSGSYLTVVVACHLLLGTVILWNEPMMWDEGPETLTQMNLHQRTIVNLMPLGHPDMPQKWTK